MIQRERFLTGCSCVAAFAVPGLALWLLSGYSYGAVLLLLAALASIPLWSRRVLPSGAKWLAIAYGAMGLIWLLDMSMDRGWGSFDRPVKYLLALPCLAFAMAFAPRAGYLWAGLAVGAIGSGGVALYQTVGLHYMRASGYTNAIQYGNLSMLLAMMCGMLLVLQWARWRWWQRAGWVVAIGMGVAGSLLSGSRGGWLALGVALPVCFWIMARLGQRGIFKSLAVLVLAAAALSQLPGVQQRLGEATAEVRSYLASGNGGTSVGHRLAHWQLALSMGLDRPLLGWGYEGYEKEKARRVAAGLVHPMVLQFSHAHSEVLDLLAKRGLMGVAALLLFYAVPIAIFWPARRRVRNAQGEIDLESYSLCMVGLLLPLSYIGFGFTQVFFAHNSGNMFYLFMCPLILAALTERRRALQQPAP